MKKFTFALVIVLTLCASQAFGGVFGKLFQRQTIQSCPNGVCATVQACEPAEVQVQPCEPAEPVVPACEPAEEQAPACEPAVQACEPAAVCKSCKPSAKVSKAKGFFRKLFGR